MYKNHILGLAGSFSQGQLTDLKRCLPDDCIDYIEEDVKVTSALTAIAPKNTASSCFCLGHD